MKYVNKLTDNELKNLFVSLVKKYYGAGNYYNDCYVLRNPWVSVKGTFGSVIAKRDFDKVNLYGVNDLFSIGLDFDDFNVSPGENSYELNWGMTQEYRKRMFDKCGNQYAIDCFLNDCGED